MKPHTTNYFNTFIEVAEDCPAAVGEVPPVKPGLKSIANIQFELMNKHPYEFTSDEVLLQVYVERNQVPSDDIEAARKELFSKGQACLRSSPLSKRYGWGIHSNQVGKVAMFGVETDEYKELQHYNGMKIVRAMRTKKG